MAGTYQQLPVHYVFSTKHRRRQILPEHEKRLWAYIIGIGDNKGIPVYAVGGMSDHLHILVSLPKTITVSNVIKELKGCSSKWMNDTFFNSTREFRWQSGYGAFCVSKPRLDNVVRYIHNQKKHHENMKFKEEFLWFLKTHDIDYDERYIWD